LVPSQFCRTHSHSKNALCAANNPITSSNNIFWFLLKTMGLFV
jgi:hypothetical protein